MTGPKKNTACHCLYLKDLYRLSLAPGKRPEKWRKGVAKEIGAVFRTVRCNGWHRFRRVADAGSKGFTLVEMLLALTLFALVVSMLYTGFNTVMTPVNTFKSGRDGHEAGLNAMRRIKWDLLSVCLTRNAVYIPANRRPAQDVDRFRFVCRPQTIGQSQHPFSRLRFASFEHLEFNRERDGAIGIIIYQVQPGSNDTWVLQRRDLASVLHRSQDEETDAEPGPVLCDRVKAFELKFMDHQGNVHNEWDSESPDFKFETPAAVTIRLETGDSQTSYVFETTVRLPVARKHSGTEK